MIFFSFVNCYSTKILIDLSAKTVSNMVNPRKLRALSGVIPIAVLKEESIVEILQYLIFSFYY